MSTTETDWADIVRELFSQTWGEQTCQVRPGDWPYVQERLFTDTPERPSYRPRFDAAVGTLATTLARTPDVAELYWAIWYTFPALDREHRVKLAERLIEAWRGEQRSAP